MISKPALIAIFVGVLNLWALLHLGSKLSKIEARLGQKSSAPALVETSINASDNGDPVAAADLKKAADVTERISQIAPDATVEATARVIAEVDEWLFAPGEEEQATILLEKAVDGLRDQIGLKVQELTAAAVEAPNGTAATEKLTQTNALLSLYPAPKTNEQRAKLEQTTALILAAAKRAEDIRRLRYNTWAVTQIDNGRINYYSIKKTIGTDEKALSQACINALASIDPAFLEPATADLYNYVFGLSKNALSESVRTQFTKGFVDPKTKRRTPVEF